MKKIVKQWERMKTDILYKNRLFQFRVDRCRVFDGRIMPQYFIMEFPDWVQVVAIDKLSHLVMVKQYRYPGADWFLEFPGGSTSPSDDNVPENTLLAAQRELREETGYSSNDWTYVGYHYPNPALLNNKCHVYLAKNCEKLSEQNLDPFEDLEVIRVPKSEIESILLNNDKNHSLMLATLAIVRSKI